MQYQPCPEDLAAIAAAAEDKRLRVARNVKEKELRHLEWQIHDQDSID